MKEENDTPNIDHLKKASEKVVELLDDPCPGLLSWNVSLLQACQHLLKILNTLGVQA